jgi:hypothetical protein
MRFAARRCFMLSAVVVVLLLFLAPATRSAADDVSAKPIETGQRVFFCGHSFHFFMPTILSDIARSAGLKDHLQVGLSAIGGSRVIQHWDVPEEKNKAKKALSEGNVDVLTLSPIFLPDPGIENFAKLALEHNPKIRILIQENWLPWDSGDMVFPPKKAPMVDHDARTAEELRRIHAPYFKSIDGHVRELNEKFSKKALFVVPCGQAMIGLREKIIQGKAAGIKTQDELFGDPLGHVRQPAQALIAYCYYASIYRKNPVGLPLPGILKNAKNANWDDSLNRVLQETAWDAVRSHPLSGVK